MAISCLIDWVGILGCGATAPTSNFYLNSLPGITLKSIEALADSEKKTYLGVWENIQTRAAHRFSSEVTSELSKKYKLKSLTQNIDLGRKIDSTATLTPGAEKRGIFFNLDEYLNQNYKASALQSHYVQAAYFYSSGVVNGATLKVYDYDLNTEVASFTFDAVEGWNTIPVYGRYAERRIILAVDCTSFTTVSLTIPESTNWCYDCGSFIKGAIISGNPSDAELSNNTHGLSVVYGVHCRFDNLVCNNKDLFTLSWAYLLARELMMERLSSDVISKWTVDKKQAEELKAHYDNEFKKELSNVLNGIDLDLCDCCLECDADITIREAVL